MSGRHERRFAEVPNLLIPAVFSLAVVAAMVGVILLFHGEMTSGAVVLIGGNLFTFAGVGLLVLAR